MIITVKMKGERQQPTVTIDTETCHYPYAVAEALQLALRLDGYDESTIKAVFNKQNDAQCQPEPPCDIARS